MKVHPSDGDSGVEDLVPAADAPAADAPAAVDASRSSRKKKLEPVRLALDRFANGLEGGVLNSQRRCLSLKSPGKEREWKYGRRRFPQFFNLRRSLLATATFLFNRFRLVGYLNRQCAPDHV